MSVAGQAFVSANRIYRKSKDLKSNKHACMERENIIKTDAIGNTIMFTIQFPILRLLSVWF